MKLKITVPDKYADLTVDQFKKLDAAWTSKELDEVDKMCKGLKILCDIDMDVAVRIPEKDVKKMLDAMGFLLKAPDPDAHPLLPFITVEGVQYGVIPDWTDLTLGEFVDLEAVNSKGTFDNLETLLAICYRPVTRRVKSLYEIEPYTFDPIRVQAMLEARMDAALGLAGFFLSTGRRLALDLLNSSAKQMEKQQR
jgi:hypothetical protein